jgi:tRNA nucleotidyltransferase/poly(A) polymerase
MPDYIFMLESRLIPDQLRVLNFLQEEAQDAQLNLYLVGGAVRDLLTGSTIRDLDFVFEGNPLRLVKHFTKPAPKSVSVNDDLKSAEIVLTSGVTLSLEMARSETYEEPGGQPTVRPATIIDDLRRRDFTINAIGLSLSAGSRGLMLDPTNGLADVETQELRTLHNYSFLHDPSRLLRLVRFGARLGFKPEERTREQFESALERGHLGYLKRGHIKAELLQLTREPNPVAAVRALQSKKMLEVFHPALQRRGADYEDLLKYQKHRQHAEESGYRFDTFQSVLYYLLKRLSGPDTSKLLKTAGMTAADMKEMKKWIPGVKKVVTALGRARNAKPRQVYQMLTEVPVEILVFALTEFRAKAKVQAKIANYLFKYRLYRDQLPAAELEALGVARGKEFDDILQQYFEAQLDGKIRKGVDVSKYLRKLAGLPEPEPEPPVVEEPPAKKPEKADQKKPAGRPAAAKSAQQRLVRKALLKKVGKQKKTGAKAAKKAAGTKAAKSAPSRKKSTKVAKRSKAAAPKKSSRKKVKAKPSDKKKKTTRRR